MARKATSPLHGPKPWTFVSIALYHGTLTKHVKSVLQGVDLAHCRTFGDFGRGFYTTTNRDQAVNWARKLAVRQNGRPAVVRFDVDRDAIAALEAVWFLRADAKADDFWSFVAHGRTMGVGHARTAATPFYDVVAGPIVADWRNRHAIRPGEFDQVSFHTKAAVALLDASQPRRQRVA